MFEQTFKNIDDVAWKEAGCGIAVCFRRRGGLVHWVSGGQLLALVQK